jgi:hypothetical protein
MPVSRAASAIESDEIYYTRTEVVDYCKETRNLRTVTEGTILRATYEGRKLLKGTKIGNRLYYARSDVDRWLAACKQV